MMFLNICDFQGTDGELCKTVGLTYKGKLLAVLRDPEIYQHRKEERVARQFGITDRRHPTISMIMSSGDWLLGGDIEVLFSFAKKPYWHKELKNALD